MMRPRSSSAAVLTAAISFAGLLATHSAMAGILNIGDGANGSNPTGLLGPGDPNLIGNGSDLSISLNGNNANVTNQVLLSILVPNDTTDLFGATNPLGTITVYPNFPSIGGQTTGSSAFTGTLLGLGTGSATYQGNGFWGDFQATPSAKLADFLGADFNSSNNGSNFVGFDSSLGVNTSQFGVYTFAVTSGPLHASQGDNPLIDILLAGGLPLGSIAVALDDNGDSTVWTNAGGINKPGTTRGTQEVPEPSSLALLGGILAGFGLLRRRLSRQACSLRQAARSV